MFLTDEERTEILSMHSNGSLYDLSLAIERAVLAKAMQKQEPVGYRAKIAAYWEFFDDKKYADQQYAQLKNAHELVDNCVARNDHWSPPEPVYAEPQPAKAAAIPEGYALAPLEPSRSMLDAGVAMALQVSVHGEGGWSKYLSGLYKQMLSASPKPEQEAKKDCCEGGQHWGHSYDCKNVID